MVRQCYRRFLELASLLRSRPCESSARPVPRPVQNWVTSVRAVPLLARPVAPVERQAQETGHLEELPAGSMSYRQPDRCSLASAWTAAARAVNLVRRLPPVGRQVRFELPSNQPFLVWPILLGADIVVGVLTIPAFPPLPTLPECPTCPPCFITQYPFPTLGALGMSAPSFRALDNRMALFCLRARPGPKLRRVLVRMLGGFDFNSAPTFSSMEDVLVSAMLASPCHFFSRQSETRFLPDLPGLTGVLVGQSANGLSLALGHSSEGSLRALLFHSLACCLHPFLACH